jgi:Peptidase family M28
VLECEVWRQEGSGSHRYVPSRLILPFSSVGILITPYISFDMMNKRLYKTYVNLSTIVMRVSNGTSEGKEHVILVNSHLDSTLPSPGAADDAISVGVRFSGVWMPLRACTDGGVLNNARMY